MNNSVSAGVEKKIIPGLCGRWKWKNIELIAGDRVRIRGKTEVYRVLAEFPQHVNSGCAPIVPENPGDKEAVPIIRAICCLIRET